MSISWTLDSMILFLKKKKMFLLVNVEVLDQSRLFKNITCYQSFSFKMKEGGGALWAWFELQIYFSGGQSVRPHFISKTKIIDTLESNVKHRNTISQDPFQSNSPHLP